MSCTMHLNLLYHAWPPVPRISLNAMQTYIQSIIELEL